MAETARRDRVALVLRAEAAGVRARLIGALIRLNPSQAIFQSM